MALQGNGPFAIAKASDLQATLTLHGFSRFLDRGEVSSLQTMTNVPTRLCQIDRIKQGAASDLI